MIEDAYHEGWKDSEDHIEERQCPGLVDDLSRKGVLERVPELRDEERRVLVVEVEDDLRDAVVAPCTVYQEEFA